METKKSFLESSTARFLIVGFLTLLMLIPLQFVKFLITERQDRQHEVVNEIADKWGKAIEVTGPILKVPYRTLNETVEVGNNNQTIKKQQWVMNYAYFLPETLDISSKVDCKSLKRNNYETTVFKSNMHFEGQFKKPVLKDIAPENVYWDKAKFVLETTNLKTMIGGANLTINGKQMPLETTYENNSNNNGQILETQAFNVLELGEKIDFSYPVVYNGSQSISLIPIGKKSTFSMTSNWQDPSFKGYFLPKDDKKITANGFESQWEINQLNRPFPQVFYGSMPQLSQYNCETQFMIQVDEYQQNERASKYGFLVIGLTFLVFFLIQMMSKINIHFFQYTMIGIALVLFYTLLIAITEHSSFSLAYIVAALAVIVMVSLYSVAILKSKIFPLFIGASLTALYGFIFVIIQLENYALLVGSVGLFLILGAVMYFSRKIEW